MSIEAVSVLIVIVNFRTPKLVVDCLQSLEFEVRQQPATRVTIVDNASGDHSADLIAAAIRSAGWSDWVTLICSPVNGGFSYGNNLAIRPTLDSTSPPRYYWLLNPDTVVRLGALRALTDFLCKNEKVGICGTGIDEADGTPWPFAFRFPSMLSELENGVNFGPVTRALERWRVLRQMSQSPTLVDWVSGASMVVRWEVFKSIGLMDEDYFLYFEETDFCLQARRADWQCWYFPQSRVLHISGQSTGVTAKSEVPKRLPGYWFDSRRRYFVKNHGRTYSIITDVIWVVAYFFRCIRAWLQRKPERDPPHYLQDFCKHSALWNSRIDVGASSVNRNG